ncbi:zinc-ribbon and DUF3426 domain-containing protein [Methyloradius palustris]|uniref:Zinc finger/thioredoxin putative domain-containing protein n=1 Tax=Methyloradius palustris TaxID=2778876 RepID=A0A8D5JKB8_9PROT|nr:zinc-ribbon and DUF3426 domain-containing protein [Methyloradius palustris]BCM23770.1 hypothetical protein ZMTM_00290 [Methyloradius palustris]
MSLVTTCPACATSFLLKPEHLAAHRGDVRCGQCDFVFNALDKLGETVEITHTETPTAEIIEPLAEIIVEATAETDLEISESAITTEPEITWPEIIEPQPEVEIESSPDIKSELPPEIPAITLDDDPFGVTSFDEIAQKPVEEPNPEQLGDAFDQTDFTDLAPSTETSITNTPSPHADLVDYRIEPEVTETPIVDVEPEKTSGTSVTDMHVSEKPEPEATSTTFIDSISKTDEQLPEKQSRRKWLSIILAVILVIAALVQSTYYFRTQLSIMLPGLKPYLVQACAKLGCTVELPKNIKLLVIDDSSIQEDTEHADVIHLSSTLINNAEFPQAYPMLELTLTDANDAPSLRRTFKPSEYLPPNTKIADGIPAGEELHIDLALTTNGEKVSGYRVQVNY